MVTLTNATWFANIPLSLSRASPVGIAGGQHEALPASIGRNTAFTRAIEWIQGDAHITASSQTRAVYAYRNRTVGKGTKIHALLGPNIVILYLGVIIP